MLRSFLPISQPPAPCVGAIRRAAVVMAELCALRKDDTTLLQLGGPLTAAKDM
jgi:hypothetical protein